MGGIQSPDDVRTVIAADLVDTALAAERSQAILDAAKQVGCLLKAAGHRFAVAGGVAAYAHGVLVPLGHDVDFCILREDAEAVAETLHRAGLPVYSPPEDWLIKSRCRDEAVDVIFEFARMPVDAPMLARAETLSVDSAALPVLAATDLLAGLLTAFSEHHCDFGAVLPIARHVREKIDWPALRARVGSAPMPAAFLYLLERLEVIEPEDAGHSADPEGGRS